MIDLDLEAVRALIPDLYPGPWRVGPSDGDAAHRWLISYPTDNPRAGLVATVPDYGLEIADFLARARTDVPALIAEVERLTDERDRARDCAVALEQQNAAALHLHQPLRLYEPCQHEHDEDEPGTTYVDEVGQVCEDGYCWTVCRECCTHGSGEQSETCATDHCPDDEAHRHSGDLCWPCPTTRALGVEP